MKKTIAAIAIIASGTMASSVASAIARPTDPNSPQPKINTVCLRIAGTAADGSVSLSTCDSSANNKRAQARLQDNGCAEGQASIRTYNKVAIAACMPPGMVQL